MKHDFDGTSTTSTFMPLSNLYFTLTLTLRQNQYKLTLRLACHSGICALTPSMTLSDHLCDLSVVYFCITQFTHTVTHSGWAVNGKSRA